MANFPTITYTNLKHKVDNGVSGGVVQSKDEAITLVFNNGIGTTNKYKASFNSPHNQITGTLSSNKELSKWQVRVTPIEVDDFGPEVGNRATLITGISANTATNFIIPITQAVFTGSPTNTYRLCLMGQSSLDYSWDCTQLYMVIDTNTSFTNTYTEVEYLGFERDSNRCCINTGVTMQQNYSIEMGVVLTNTSSDNQFLFSDRASSGGYFHVYVNPSRLATYQTPNVSTVTMNLGQIYVFKKVGTSCYVDGAYYGVSGNSTQTTQALLIGGVDSASGSRGFYGRCYYFKIWDGSNTLIRDLVPCIRNSDGKPGMYDRVNNTFYTNAGSGEFKYGPLKSVPATYQQVDYIQSDTAGKAYINTLCPIYNGMSWKFEASVMMGDTWFSGYESIYNSTFNSDTFEGWINNSSNKGNLNFRYNDTALRDIAQLELSTKYKIAAYYDGASLYSYVDDIFKKTVAISKTTRDASTIYLTIGHNNDATTFKYYWVKLYKNDELLRNFIPCYRKSDNVIGMLDLVNNVFYTNAGSGTFTKGNNVSNKNYIK